MRRRWRLENKRIPFEKPFDPFVIGINRYVCSICREIKYYKGEEDSDSPQYITLRKYISKLGYGIGALVCHDCWHEKGYENPVVRHNSRCRVCELAYWTRVAARRTKVQLKLAKEAQVLDTEAEGSSKQVSNSSQQVWVRSGISMSARWQHGKNKSRRRS